MKNAVYIAIGGLLLMFLLLNIASSQTVSPLYFELIKRNQQAAVSLLQQIKPLSGFNYYKNLFDLTVQKQFLLEEARRNAEIQRLEGLLVKNPYSRDLLYNLYLIYDQAGNEPKAQEYLKRAQEVDPIIK